MRRPNKLNLWLTLFTLTLAAMFGVNVASGTQGINTTSTRTPYPRILVSPTVNCPPNCNTVAGYVIVKLRVTFQPENTISATALIAQRSAIQVVQLQFENFLGSFRDMTKSIDYSSRVIAAHPNSPYLFGYIAPNDIYQLSNTSLIEAVLKFDPLLPEAQLGIDKVILDVNAKLPYLIPRTGQINCFQNTCSEILNRSIQEGALPVTITLNVKSDGGMPFTKETNSISIYNNTSFIQSIVDYAYQSSGYNEMRPMDFIFSTGLNISLSSQGIKEVLKNNLVKELYIDTLSSGDFERRLTQEAKTRIIPTKVSKFQNVPLNVSRTPLPSDQRIKHIKADEAWSKEITGRESYIFLIDDGVWKHQPAVKNNVDQGFCRLFDSGVCKDYMGFPDKKIHQKMHYTGGSRNSNILYPS